MAPKGGNDVTFQHDPKHAETCSKSIPGQKHVITDRASQSSELNIIEAVKSDDRLPQRLHTIYRLTTLLELYQLWFFLQSLNYLCLHVSMNCSIHFPFSYWNRNKWAVAPVFHKDTHCHILLAAIPVV